MHDNITTPKYTLNVRYISVILRGEVHYVDDDDNQMMREGLVRRRRRGSVSTSSRSSMPDDWADEEAGADELHSATDLQMHREMMQINVINHFGSGLDLCFL